MPNSHIAKHTKRESKLPPGRRRIFLLDDHSVLREGLREIINQEEDLVVCGEAGEARSALSEVETTDPDLVLVDISLPGPNGIEFIKNLRSRDSEVSVAVLSMHDEALYAERALRAGALAYISKNDSANEVLKGIRAALKGSFHMSFSLEEDIFCRFLGRDTRSGQQLEELSDRELEVFELIGRGKLRSEIASALKVSPKTVDSYKEKIKRKLGIASSHELGASAYRWLENVNEKKVHDA